MNENTSMNERTEQSEQRIFTDDQNQNNHIHTSHSHQHQHHSHNLHKFRKSAITGHSCDGHDHLNIDKYRDWFDAIMANNAQDVQDILDRATR